jgi:hypothetical protein
MRRNADRLVDLGADYANGGNLQVADEVRGDRNAVVATLVLAACPAS